MVLLRDRCFFGSWAALRAMLQCEVASPRPKSPHLIERLERDLQCLDSLQRLEQLEGIQLAVVPQAG
jgi:hypothetical protein